MDYECECEFAEEDYVDLVCGAGLGIEYAERTDAFARWGFDGETRVETNPIQLNRLSTGSAQWRILTALYPSFLPPGVGRDSLPAHRA